MSNNRDELTNDNNEVYSNNENTNDNVNYQDENQYDNQNGDQNNNQSNHKGWKIFFTIIAVAVVVWLATYAYDTHKENEALKQQQQETANQGYTVTEDNNYKVYTKGDYAVKHGENDTKVLVKGTEADVQNGASNLSQSQLSDIKQFLEEIGLKIEVELDKIGNIVKIDIQEK